MIYEWRLCVKVMEDMRNEAAKSAVKKDRTKNTLEILAVGLSIEKTAQHSQLTIGQAKELAMSKTTQ